MRNVIYLPCKHVLLHKNFFRGVKIAWLCKHDECEHKKMLNLCTQYKISTAYCDLYLNAEVGGSSIRLRIKQKNDQNKNNEIKQNPTTKK